MLKINFGWLPQPPPIGHLGFTFFQFFQSDQNTKKGFSILTALQGVDRVEETAEKFRNVYFC